MTTVETPDLNEGQAIAARGVEMLKLSRWAVLVCLALFSMGCPVANRSAPEFDRFVALTQVLPDLSRPEGVTCILREPGHDPIPEPLKGRECPHVHGLYRFEGVSCLDGAATSLDSSRDLVGLGLTRDRDGLYRVTETPTPRECRSNGVAVGEWTGRFFALTPQGSLWVELPTPRPGRCVLQFTHLHGLEY